MHQPSSLSFSSARAAWRAARVRRQRNSTYGQGRSARGPYQAGWKNALKRASRTWRCGGSCGWADWRQCRQYRNTLCRDGKVEVSWEAYPREGMRSGCPWYLSLTVIARKEPGKLVMSHSTKWGCLTPIVTVKVKKLAGRWSILVLRIRKSHQSLDRNNNLVGVVYSGISI